MAWNKMVLSPITSENGWAVFLETPNDKQPVVNVMTERYIKHIIPLANYTLMNNMEMGQYVPPADLNPDKLIDTLHTLLIRAGYGDRTPRGIETATQFFDYDEKQTDPAKCIIEVKKRYQLLFGGTLLVPPYPEMFPTPFLPLPPSPI